MDGSRCGPLQDASTFTLSPGHVAEADTPSSERQRLRSGPPSSGLKGVPPVSAPWDSRTAPLRPFLKTLASVILLEMVLVGIVVLVVAFNGMGVPAAVPIGIKEHFYVVRLFSHSRIIEAHCMYSNPLYISTP